MRPGKPVAPRRERSLRCRHAPVRRAGTAWLHRDRPARAAPGRAGRRPPRAGLLRPRARRPHLCTTRLPRRTSCRLPSPRLPSPRLLRRPATVPPAAAAVPPPRPAAPRSRCRSRAGCPRRGSGRRGGRSAARGLRGVPDGAEPSSPSSGDTGSGTMADCVRRRQQSAITPAPVHGAGRRRSPRRAEPRRPSRAMAAQRDGVRPGARRAGRARPRRHPAPSRRRPA